MPALTCCGRNVNLTKGITMQVKTIEQLLASIAMTNNGYLFAPSPDELAVAYKHTDVVDVRNGQIHIRGKKCEHPREPAKIDWSKFYSDDPDYEGAILARQERMMGY
jgi:hypothetical protein